MRDSNSNIIGVCGGRLAAQARANAARKKLPCTITQRTIEKVFEAQDGRCAVSGVRFNERQVPGCKRRPWYPSIDRLDNREGYVKSNIRLVCVIVNYALNEWPDSVLHELASAMAAPPPQEKTLDYEREIHYLREKCKRLFVALCKSEGVSPKPGPNETDFAAWLDSGTEPRNIGRRCWLQKAVIDARDTRDF